MNACIRPASSDDISGCAEIIHSLPKWFGDPVANKGFVESVTRLPAFVAHIDDRLAAL